MSTSVVTSGGGSLPTNNVGYGEGNWGAPQGPPAEGGPNLRQLIGRTLAALKRYRWLILVILAIGTATGFGLTRFVAPKYNVNGTIWIAENSGKSGPVQAPGLILNDLGWIDLVKSFIILDPVVSNLSLYVTPKSGKDTLLFRQLLPTDSLVPGSYRLSISRPGKKYRLTRLAVMKGEKEEVIESGTLGDSIGRPVGFLWQPTPAMVRAGATDFDFDVITPREASLKLQKELTVGQPPNSNLMMLSLKGEHRELLATTLNSLLRRFRMEAERLKKDNLVQIAKTVDEQKEDASNRLYQAEGALQGYKYKTITQPTDNVPIQAGISLATNPVMNNYFTDKVRFDGVRSDRQQLQRILEESKTRGGKLSVEAIRGAPGLLASSALGKELDTYLNDLSTANATLRGLREKFTDEYVLVKNELAKINRLETELIPQQAQRLLTQLSSTEAEMSRRIDGASEEIRKIPQRMITEGRLQEEVNVRRQIYQDLQTRAVHARLNEKTVMPDIAILDTAVAPRLPSTDTSLSIIALAAMASLGLGLGLALLLDRMDGRFRYPEQATSELGLDIVGAIPSYTSPRSQRLKLEQASQLVESFRSLALSVRSAFPPGSPVQLTISSPGPGDGKSTISINLANALAEGGYRTLLIDGDIRRGALHESCPPAEQSPGLLDYLAGETTLGEIVKQTQLHVNLSLIPCGARRRQGPELLASQRMSLMLRELRGQFDAIVVDCAPLGAGIDAFALGAATGTMLLVLRAGETDRRLAQSKLTTLDRLPIRVLGAVLNDIGESPEFKYYHYLDGYSSPDSIPEVAMIGSSSGSHNGNS